MLRCWTVEFICIPSLHNTVSNCAMANTLNDFNLYWIWSNTFINGVFDSLLKGDSKELTTAENVVLYLPNEHGILKASNQLIFNDDFRHRDRLGAESCFSNTSLFTCFRWVISHVLIRRAITWLNMSPEMKASSVTARSDVSLFWRNGMYSICY
jgi:hypothetical protein